MMLFAPVSSLAQGNTTNDSYNRAKRMLEREVYYDHRITVYCLAEFDERKNIILPDGFETPSHPKRALRVEWEHAVPAENFGRAFSEWREGSPECINNKGNPFRGRRCAEKVNMEFRHMQSDMYNLYPAIGSVNAVRSNHQYAQLTDSASTFGSCPAKYEGNRFEPPNYAKGALARTALYMEDSYPHYRLSSQQKSFLRHGIACIPWMNGNASEPQELRDCKATPIILSNPAARKRDFYNNPI